MGGGGLSTMQVLVLPKGIGPFKCWSLAGVFCVKKLDCNVCPIFPCLTVSLCLSLSVVFPNVLLLLHSPYFWTQLLCTRLPPFKIYLFIWFHISTLLPRGLSTPLQFIFPDQTQRQHSHGLIPRTILAIVWEARIDKSAVNVFSHLNPSPLYISSQIRHNNSCLVALCFDRGYWTNCVYSNNNFLIAPFIQAHSGKTSKEYI